MTHNISSLTADARVRRLRFLLSQAPPPLSFLPADPPSRPVSLPPCLPPRRATKRQGHQRLRLQAHGAERHCPWVDLPAPPASLCASPSSSGPSRWTDDELLPYAASLPPASFIPCASSFLTSLRRSLPVRQPASLSLASSSDGELASSSRPHHTATGPPLRATKILRLWRETTQICVAVRPFPKMYTLFASSVGGCFWRPIAL